MTEKALSSLRLAGENLRRKPYRSLGLASLVGLFAAVLFGGSIVNGNLRQGLESLSSRLGADLLVVPLGYELATQSALLRGEPSTFYMKKEVLEKIRQMPNVSAATPQFFLASLDSACCAEAVQIIGYDPDSDFLLKPWMTDQVLQLQEGEIIVGSKIITLLGENIFFFDTTYKVVGKMEPTGLGLDTSVFMPLSSIYGLMQRNPLLALKVTHEAGQPENFISSIAVKVRPDIAPDKVASEIRLLYASEYDLNLVVTNTMVSDISRRLADLSTLVYGAAFVFWLLAVVVLSLFFSVTLNERKRELSLLRILGASRAWLARLLLQEALLISLGGALAGLALSALVIFPFGTLIFQNLGLPRLQISWEVIAGYTLLTLLIAGATGPVASIYSALSITRYDTYDTLREGE